MGHTFIRCNHCNTPLAVTSVFPNGILLITGAKCAVCGEGHVFEDNGFKYDELAFKNVDDTSGHVGVKTVDEHH